jgi:hypothetical protein
MLSLKCFFLKCVLNGLLISFPILDVVRFDILASILGERRSSPLEFTCSALFTLLKINEWYKFELDSLQ